jgi:hypothetical protein
MRMQAVWHGRVRRTNQVEGEELFEAKHGRVVLPKDGVALLGLLNGEVRGALLPANQAAARRDKTTVWALRNGLHVCTTPPRPCAGP